MTESIYKNPFVFEKRGPHFSDYIGLMIKHFRDKKDEFGLTTRHHINPKFLTNNKYDNSPWNVVHLLHEVHVQAHTYLKEAMPDNPKASSALSRTKNGGCPRLRMKKLYEDPDFVKKKNEGLQSDNTKMKMKAAQQKRFEDPLEHEKVSESVRKRYEDPNERLKSSKSAKKQFEDPIQRNIVRDRFKDKPHKTIKCEHCGKEGSVNLYPRWHGDNCIENPESTRYKKKHKIE